MFRRIRPGVARLFRLGVRQPDSTRAEMDAEIQHHLEEREAQLVARGLSADDARAEARRRFGDLDSAQRTLHASARRRDSALAGRESWRTLRNDLAFALRSLRRAPSFLVVAVASLAIGIGANAAMFSVVDAILLKPLDYPSAGQLVRVWDQGFTPPGVYDIIREDATSYAGLAGYDGGTPVSLLAGDEATRVLASRVLASTVTPNLLDVLQVRPLVGRGFRDDDGSQANAPTALLSYTMWRDQFGLDASVVGRSIALDGIPHTIIGVMPQAFHLPDVDAALFTPVRAPRGSAAYWWTTYLRVIGRLASGATPASATTEVALLLDRARGAFPNRMPDAWGTGATVSPLQESIVGGSRTALLLMMGAVALVLLVACVNVATLYMGRTATRARELAVRSALGAGRARIVRLLVTECAVVAALGTVAGLALAAVALRLLVTVIPADTPRIAEIALDGRVVGFGVLLMLASVALFGLVPSLRAAQPDLSRAIKGDGAAGRPTGLRTASLLVVGQMAMVVVLVIGAGLVTRSVWQLRQVALGFRTEQVLTTALPLPSFASDTATRAPIYFADVLDRVQSLPGVQHAALASTAPFGDGLAFSAMEVQAHPTPSGGAAPTPAVVAVSPDYFAALDMPLVSGRLPTSNDRAGTERIAVVDEAAARTLWPNEDPIGQRIRYVWDQGWITIVGVVGNVKRDDLTADPIPSLYVPMVQDQPRAMRLLLRVDERVAPTEATVRSTVRAADATVPVGRIEPLQDLVLGSTAQTDFAALLLSLFAVIALLLGGVGVYGVMSANVNRRTRELGVRMALGAQSTQVLGMVLRQGMRLVLTGVALGVVLALVGARLIERFLYGVSPFDTFIFATVPVVLAATAVLATIVPARRASRVAPMMRTASDRAVNRTCAPRQAHTARRGTWRPPGCRSTRFVSATSYRSLVVLKRTEYAVGYRPAAAARSGGRNRRAEQVRTRDHRLGEDQHRSRCRR